jgi:chemotaxis protein MotB
MPRGPDPDESGIQLRPGDYPLMTGKRPPPAPPPLAPPPWKERVPWKKVATYGGPALAGIVIGFLLAPASKDTGGPARKALAAAEQRLATVEFELTTARVALGAEQEKTKTLITEKTKLDAKVAESKVQSDRLAAVVGKSGEVTSADGEIRLQLVDKILFRTGEAELTAQGQQVLSSVGKALNEKDIEDKQIWVQGHTDDDPIFVPKPKPTKGKKPKGKKPPPPPSPVVRFASNWELSAARALTVVHYLQDKMKVDPRRLAAVAFGEFRPASQTKAKNRRIEIVLYPRHSITAPR